MLFPTLRHFDLRRSSIARDLIVGLVLTIAAVFAMAGGVNYLYSTRRDALALHEKADEVMGNLALVLGSPLWNFNVDELRKIIEVYRQSGIVLDIRLADDAGKEIIPTKGDPSDAFLERSRIVYHDGVPIGRLTVFFSDEEIAAKQRQFAAYSAVVFSLLTLALAYAVLVLLKRCLTTPMLALTKGLERISGGDYAHRFAPVRQADVHDVMVQVMGMAGEIARRESAIEENRYKLEILNQAILDIFSCSDAYSLTRATMALAHKVCGVTMGWFLPRADGAGSPSPSDSGDGSSADEAGEILPPMLCVEGEVFDTKPDEVAAFVAQPASDRIFPFTVSSRYRTIGDLTLGFAKAPDPSVAALLRSLMSLANLAMTRQSFIRETAFIAAELQVAETVQRSMLPDESRLQGKARIAYHYEPVLRVGGDWFSVMESRDGDSLYVVLGDVTGHGLAQGLVTTAMAGAIRIVQSMLRHATAPVFETPSEIVTQLDDVIAHVAGKSNLRMTCVAARLDFRSMQISVCNAGHTFPLVIQSPSEPGGRPRIQSLAKSQQLMLGEEPADGRDKRYVDAVYPFHRDDLLLFYTDGLTEAQDRDGKAFIRKFHRHLNNLQGVGDAASIKDKLIELFRTHIEGVPAKDDICVFVIGAAKERATRAA